MCGIIGYIGQDDAYKIVTKGIELLEYRGYDSFGLYFPPWLAEEFLFKRVGVIGEEENRKQLEGFLPEGQNYCTGIGHTRWATHGRVTRANAHPHTLGTVFGKVDTAVIHNGTIKFPNKYMIMHQDVTDTEKFTEILQHNINLMTILNVCDHATACEKALEELISEISGDNAFLIVFPGINNRIYSVITGNQKLYYTLEGHIASDLSVLSEWAEYAAPVPKGMHIFTDTSFARATNEKHMKDHGIKLTKSKRVSTDTHRMKDEINEKFDLVSLVDQPKMWDMGQVDLVGCGSSYNASLFGARCFREISGVLAFAHYASELLYERPYCICDPSCEYDAVVFISQSGETHDVNIVAQNYETFNINSVSLTNNQPNSLMQFCNYNIPIDVGQELAVAATKTFTGSLLRLMQMSSPAVYKDCISKLDTELQNGQLATNFCLKSMSLTLNTSNKGLSQLEQ